MKIARIVIVIIAALLVFGFLLCHVSLSRCRYYHLTSGARRETSALDFGQFRLITFRDSVVRTWVSDCLVGQSLPRRSDPGWELISENHCGILSESFTCTRSPYVLSDSWRDFLESCCKPFLSDMEYRGLLKLMLSPTDERIGVGLMEPDVLDALEKAEGASVKHKLLIDRLGPSLKEYIGGGAAGSPTEGPSK